VIFLLIFYFRLFYFRLARLLLRNKYRFKAGDFFISDLQRFVLKIHLISGRAKPFPQFLEWFTII